jgi:hypothetical protein
MFISLEFIDESGGWMQITGLTCFGYLTWNGVTNDYRKLAR